MRLTLNQTYEYLTCVLWETTHHERIIDDQLIRQLILYARILPMRGAVYAMDTIFLSPTYPIVVQARKQLPQTLSSFTIHRTQKQLYVAAVANIEKKTLPEYIASDLNLKEKLQQLQIFLIYSTIDRSYTELENAKDSLTDILINTGASSLDPLFTHCLKLLDER